MDIGNSIIWIRGEQNLVADLQSDKTRQGQKSMVDKLLAILDVLRKYIFVKYPTL